MKKEGAKQGGGGALGRRHPGAHIFQPFGSDPRFERCAIEGCAEARRIDRQSDNPMVQWHGFGPEGATCGGCAFLEGRLQSKRWYKCRLRSDLTHSARTDQRLRWEACAKYAPRPPEEGGEEERAKARRTRKPSIEEQLAEIFGD